MDNADTGTDEPSKFVAMLPNMLLTRHERARHGFDNAPAPPSGTHRPKLRVPAPPRPARQVSLSTNGVADGNSPIKEYLSLREDAPRRKLPSYAGPNSPRLSIAPPQKPSVAGRRRRILRPAASEGFSSTKQRAPMPPASGGTLSIKAGNRGSLAVWPAGESVKAKTAARLRAATKVREAATAGESTAHQERPPSPISSSSPRNANSDAQLPSKRPVFVAKRPQPRLGVGWKGERVVLRKASDREVTDSMDPQHANNAVPDGSLRDAPLATASALLMGPVNTRERIMRKHAAPTFLAELEEFVEQELQLQGIDKSGPHTTPNEARLQVYKEAAQFFMEEFSTYRPFLSAVFHEYDALLEHYSHKLHYIAPLEARLTTLQQEAGRILNVAHKKYAAEKENLETIQDDLLAKASSLQARLAASAAEGAKLRADLDKETESARIARAASRGVVLALRRAEAAEKEAVDRRALAEDQVRAMKDEVMVARQNQERVEHELMTLRATTDGMVPAREAERMRSAIADLQRDLEDLRTSYGSLKQEHSAVISTMRQLTARRQAMEAERDRLARIRKLTQDRPPPQWMRRLAVKLQVQLKWNSVQQPDGTEGSQLDDDFDADKVLVHFLQAIQDLKGRIQKGEEANAELRTQLDAANAHAAHARKAARKAAAVAATSASAATASPHQAAATQSGGDGKRETRVSKPGDSATVTQDEGGAGASADENKSSTSQAPPERDSKLTLRPATTASSVQATEAEFSAAVKLATVTTRSQFFDGLGLDVGVPRYLRAAGKVRNLMLGKAETERLVKECWMMKQQHSDSVALADFFGLFLQTRFPAPGAAVEMAYNIVDSLSRHSYDSDLAVFLRILDGELPEELHHQEVLMLQRVSSACVALDRKVHNGALLKTVPVRAFFAMLRNDLFAAKSHKRMNRLAQALQQDSNVITQQSRPQRKAGRSEDPYDGLCLTYEMLFRESAQGDQGMFCEELRAQHLQEFEEYKQLLESRLNAAVPLAAPGKLREVTVEMATRVLQSADPEKSAVEVTSLVARGFARPAEALTSDEMRVPLASFLRRLSSGWLQRSTPVDEVGPPTPPRHNSLPPKSTRRRG